MGTFLLNFVDLCSFYDFDVFSIQVFKHHIYKETEIHLSDLRYGNFSVEFCPPM